MKRKPKCYASGKSRDFCPYYVFGGACKMFSEEDHLRYCEQCFAPDKTTPAVSRGPWLWLTVAIATLAMLVLAVVADAAEVRATPGGEWKMSATVDGMNLTVEVGNDARHWRLWDSPSPPNWEGRYRLRLDWYGSRYDWSVGRNPERTEERDEAWYALFGGCTMFGQGVNSWYLTYRLYGSADYGVVVRDYYWIADGGCAVRYCRAVLTRTDAEADDILLGEITIGGFSDAPTVRVRDYTHRRGGFVAIY